MNGEITEYLKSAKNSQKSLLHPLIKLILIIFTIGASVTFLGSIIVIINVRTIAANASLLALITAGISVVVLYYLLKIFRSVPEFVRRWEKKVLD